MILRCWNVSHFHLEKSLCSSPPKRRLLECKKFASRLYQADQSTHCTFSGILTISHDQRMLSLAVKIPVEKENADSIKPVYKFATAFLNHRLFLLLHLLCPSCFTVQCNATLLAMEDVVESPDPTTSSSYSPLECTYSITVYAGYGVEIQVMCIKIHNILASYF